MVTSVRANAQAILTQMDMIGSPRTQTLQDALEAAAKEAKTRIKSGKKKRKITGVHDASQHTAIEQLGQSRAKNHKPKATVTPIRRPEEPLVPPLNYNPPGFNQAPSGQGY